MGHALARAFSGLAPRRLAGGRTGAAGRPRIAVLGNCQGGAIASAMRLLLPEASVEFVTVYGIAKRHKRMADLIAALKRFDVVFAAGFSTHFRDGGDFEMLRAGLNLVQIPIIVFPAFHPDIVYVGDMSDRTGKSFVRTPLATYNSALALYGFKQGFSVAQTLRLYDAEIFRLLGYMSVWSGAQASLLQLGRDAGLDLTPHLARWTRRGCFMHLINHPKMFVASDLARALLEKAAIPFVDCDLDSYAADEIVHLGAWPVYPPIAAQLGLRGDYAFLQPGTPPRTIGLGRFVEGSFSAYRAAAKARLACERVDAWCAHAELGVALKDRAGPA